MRLYIQCISLDAIGQGCRYEPCWVRHAKQREPCMWAMVASHPLFGIMPWGGLPSTAHPSRFCPPHALPSSSPSLPCAPSQCPARPRTHHPPACPSSLIPFPPLRPFPSLLSALRDHARTIPGKAQLFMASYAKALESIPRQLCDNAVREEQVVFSYC